MAMAAPRVGSRPVVIDMATSATARVNVMEAAARGTPIPSDWALDAEGAPTTDAATGLAGSIAPVGGAKGYGLALMVELLAAGVTGSNWSFQTSSLTDNDGGPPDIGQLFIAINPARLGGSKWASRLEELAAEIRAQENSRLPGDRRHLARDEAEHSGVEVPAELLALIEKYASP
jgi:(2R)-3-sulfolactate dehydrogenase (NADP+)